MPWCERALKGPWEGRRPRSHLAQGHRARGAGASRWDGHEARTAGLLVSTAESLGQRDCQVVGLAPPPASSFPRPLPHPPG